MLYVCLYNDLVLWCINATGHLLLCMLLHFEVMVHTDVLPSCIVNNYRLACVLWSDINQW